MRVMAHHSVMSVDLERLRWSYEMGGLSEEDLEHDWLAQFRAWLADAIGAELIEPNAMVMATAAPGGEHAANGYAGTWLPSTRTVLLRAVDERGFACYTSLASRKGRETRSNPAASLLFPWVPLQRQVVVVGAVEPVGDQECEDYWATRPRGHQIGAVTSPQSEVISSRSELEQWADQIAERYPPGVPVPRPADWGGLRVVPESVEFWQGRRNRLHDRLRFRHDRSAGWVVERLAP